MLLKVPLLIACPWPFKNLRCLLQERNNKTAGKYSTSSQVRPSWEARHLPPGPPQEVNSLPGRSLTVCTMRSLAVTLAITPPNLCPLFCQSTANEQPASTDVPICRQGPRCYDNWQKKAWLVCALQMYLILKDGCTQHAQFIQCTSTCSQLYISLHQFTPPLVAFLSVGMLCLFIVCIHKVKHKVEWHEECKDGK